MVGVFSAGIARIRDLTSFLGAEEVVFRPDLRRRRVDTVVGWGRKPNTKRAERWARSHGARWLLLEDGFLRSVRPGKSEPPLSLVVDDVGVYYDATRPSRLEHLLAGTASDADLLTDLSLRERARAAMRRIRRAGISKYNHASREQLPQTSRRRVLVVDQTEGDLSVRLGLTAEGGFQRMLETALLEHPDAEVVVKAHPETVAGSKGGYLTRSTSRERVRLLNEDVNAVDLLQQVDSVYVMTSLMGLEALLLGKPVSCFGAPFYAGWGLTDDRVEIPRRGRPRSVEELFVAAYMLYARYIDPETGERCEIERIIEHLEVQREAVESNAGVTYCVGLSAWKRGFVPAFLRSPAGRVECVRTAWEAERRGLDAQSRIAVWGGRRHPEVEEVAFRHRVPLVRVEDGFLRSVGLGSDLAVPASLVVDESGLHYDPSRPSDLERMLQRCEFSEVELDRAGALRRSIVERGVSKYNVGARRRVPVPTEDRRRVLVVGQVEDDASVELGCPSLRTNADLLCVAREREPHAWIIYKPHPDVVSGNRVGAIPKLLAEKWCDVIVEDAPIVACLAEVDAVHTLTSLVGFEALLRGREVVVWGLPFYAGWGLTQDHHSIPRRTRRLSIDELVCGALIRYPRYLSERTGTFTTPEAVLGRLAGGATASDSIRMAWPLRQLRKAVNLVRGMTHAP